MTAITKDNIDELQMRMLHQRLQRFSRLRLVLFPLLALNCRPKSMICLGFSRNSCDLPR
jgi:hypothetical protein